VRTLDGVDIDGEAIETAWREHRASNLRFAVGDAMALPYPEQSFDLVVCNHVYEHVPDTPRMFSEIRRVLKPGGICYLAAGNRLKIMEDHFHLPFLSIMPKPMANRVLHLLGKGDYYENLLTYWELRRLVGSFEVIDYTGRIIREPERFQATDMLTSRSLKQSLALAMLRLAYWAFPTYIWLLRTI
jgi:ubiquinone/menaquinone biosynthesis C-methylase UbiE